jgi:nucleoid-associated protein YgaU
MVQKDLKIGLILGLILVLAVVLLLATDPRLSPKARMLHLQDATAQDKPPGPSNDDSQSQTTQHQITLSQPSSIELPGSELARSDSEPDILIQNKLSGDEPIPETLNAAKPENRQFTIDEDQSEPTDVPQFVQAEKIKTQRFHIVRKDQTLSAISRIYYGSANKWQKIVAANRDLIKDPNKLNPGMKLIIPN